MPMISHSDAPLYVIPRVRTRLIVGEALDSDSDCSLFEQTIPSTGQIPPHYHDCEELVVLLEGRAWVTEGETSLSVTAPATLQVAAGVVHSIVPLEGEVRLLAFFPKRDPKLFGPDGIERHPPWRGPQSDTPRNH